MRLMNMFCASFVFASLLFITPALASANGIDSGNKPFFGSVKDVRGGSASVWIIDGRIPAPIPEHLTGSERHEYLEDHESAPSAQPVLVTVRIPRKAVRGIMLYPGRTIGIIGSYDAQSYEIEADSIMGFSWSMGVVPEND